MKLFVSHTQDLCSHRWRTVLTFLAIVSLITGTLGISNMLGISDMPLALAAKPKLKPQEQRPCDIYAAAHTPCVAAHSMVRALSSRYNGKLYQVQRQSDSKTLDIKTLKAGGYADAAAQDKFCAGTSCVITIIYDQTKNHNDLTVAGPSGMPSAPYGNGTPDHPADAAALPVVVGGHHVYGLDVEVHGGYRNNHTKGIATNDMSEEAYMVTSAKHVNGGCCFDYGNAETKYYGGSWGHMDAVNFGTECWFPPCSSPGPWVQADLEWGLFAGGNGSNLNNKGNSSDFVTALLKNDGKTTYAIKGGDAQQGRLTTWYDGPLPPKYEPMHLEGAIILGIGGDNSNGCIGDFFEGAMIAGRYPTNTTDDAIQASIVAAGYGSHHSISGGSGGSKPKPKLQVDAVTLPSRRHP
jgi:hypothetical protein